MIKIVQRNTYELEVVESMVDVLAFADDINLFGNIQPLSHSN